MSTDRNYKRLLHANRGVGNRDNVERILEKSLNSNDIYFRDFYFVSSNSTDDYADKLTSEKWKEFSVIGDTFDNSYVVELSMIHLLQLEYEIKSIIDKGDKEYLLVVLFFTIIHDIYVNFSDDFRELTDDLKIEIIQNIRLFQDAKSGKTRVSKITTSYQKFLYKELNKGREVKLTQAYVKKYISRYKKLITNIFQSK